MEQEVKKDQRLGTDNIKDVLREVFADAELVEALADGLDLSDVASVAKAVQKAPAFLAALKSGQVLPEAKDLDDAEKADLKNFCVVTLDLKHDDIEQKIESVLLVLVDLSDLLKLLP